MTNAQEADAIYDYDRMELGMLVPRKAHARRGTRGVRGHPVRVPVRPPAYGEWTPEELRNYLRSARGVTAQVDESREPPPVGVRFIELSPEQNLLLLTAPTPAEIRRERKQ
jgi:hypothetical protein